MRPLLFAALAATAAMAGAGCSRPAAEWVLFDDPLLRNAKAEEEGAFAVGECSCADETYAAFMQRWNDRLMGLVEKRTLEAARTRAAASARTPRSRPAHVRVAER